MSDAHRFRDKCSAISKKDLQRYVKDTFFKGTWKELAPLAKEDLCKMVYEHLNISYSPPTRKSPVRSKSPVRVRSPVRSPKRTVLRQLKITELPKFPYKPQTFRRRSPIRRTISPYQPLITDYYSPKRAYAIRSPRRNTYDDILFNMDRPVDSQDPSPIYDDVDMSIYLDGPIDSDADDEFFRQ